MLARQTAVQSALQRADDFIAANINELASSVDLTTARKRLEDLVASFMTHAVDQNANDRDTKGETAKQQQVRQALASEVMRPIAEIARRNLRNTPEFKALQMPRVARTGSFIASAKGMVAAATIHKETLIERGLPADFLDQFHTRLTALEESVNNRERSRTQRMGATKALTFTEQEGRSVLKVLDALIRPALRGKAALLGTWEGARAIHRRPGGAPSAPQTAATEAPATPATPPAAPAA